MNFHMPTKTFRFSITEYAFWTIEGMTFKRGLISEGILNSARAQHDGVRTTMKKGTPKIPSKSISRIPMGSLVGH